MWAEAGFMDEDKLVNAVGASEQQVDVTSSEDRHSHLDLDKQELAILGKQVLKEYTSICTLFDALPADARFRAQLTDQQSFRDQLTRFKVWSGSTALIHDGHASLAYRLRRAHNVERLVSRILVDLSQNLTKLLEIIRGDRPPYEELARDDSEASSDEESSDESSSTSDSELRSRYDQCSRINDQLYRVAERIGASSQRLGGSKALQYQGLDPDTGIDIIEAYRFWDRKFLVDLIASHGRAANEPDLAFNSGTSTPTAPQDENNHVADTNASWLIERLVEANARRRQQLKYWQRHKQKLDHQLPLDIAAPRTAALLQVPTAKDESLQDTQLHPDTNPSALTSAPTLPVHDAQDRFDDASSFVSSSSAFTSAYTEDDLSVNQSQELTWSAPPAKPQFGKHFECPLCFTILRSKFLRPRAWREHVSEDLRPYLCTFEGCQQPNKLFDTREDWMSHESMHRRSFVCSIHNFSTSNQDDLEIHMTKEHVSSFGGDMTKALTDSVRFAADSRNCPFCGLNLAEQAPTHLGQHLERVAGMALRGTYAELEGSDSGENDSNRADAIADTDGEGMSEVTLQYSDGQETGPHVQVGPKAPLENYALGIVCESSLAFHAVCLMLDEENTMSQPKDGNLFQCGKIGQHMIVIANFDQEAKDSSSVAALHMHMLLKYPDLELIFSLGVGGGAPSARHDIRLGDVAVDMSRIEFFDEPRMKDPLVDKDNLDLRSRNRGLYALAIDKILLDLREEYEVKGHHFDAVASAMMERKSLDRKTYQRPAQETDRFYRPEVFHKNGHGTDCAINCGTSPDLLVSRKIRNEDDDSPVMSPVIHIGLISSQDRLMDNASERDAVALESKVICFDMSRVYWPAFGSVIKIRGICDYSDSHRNGLWQGYASMMAAIYCKDVILRVAPGDDATRQHPPTSTEMLRSACWKKGDWKTAEELELRTWKILQCTRGPCHIDTLQVMANLSTIYINQRRFDEAERFAKLALEAGRTSLGEKHTVNLNNMRNLVTIYNNQGRLAASGKLAMQIQDEENETKEKPYPRIRDVEASLASAYLLRARYEEAGEFSLSVFDERSILLMGEHSLSLRSRAALKWGLSILDAGKARLAQEVGRKIMERRIALLGFSHPTTLQIFLDLALLILSSGPKEEAERIVAEVTRTQRENSGHEPLRVLADVTFFAATDRDMKGPSSNNEDLEKAEMLMKEVLKERRLRLGNEAHKTRESMASLGDLYMHQRRFGKAEELQAEVLRQNKTTFGDMHHNTLESMIKLAVSYEGLGRKEEAERLLRFVDRARDTKAQSQDQKSLENTINLMDDDAGQARVVRTEESELQKPESAETDQTDSLQAAQPGKGSNRSLLSGFEAYEVPDTTAKTENWLERQQSAVSETAERTAEQFEVSVNEATNISGKPIGDDEEVTKQYEEAPNTLRDSGAALSEGLSKVKLSGEADEQAIELVDHTGRKYGIPWAICKTWEGMEKLIKDAFSNNAAIREHIRQGNYDLTGPDGRIILPQVWEMAVRPGWSVTMHMQPLQEEKGQGENAHEAAQLPASEDKNQPSIRFKDAVGRKFALPWAICKEWKGMEASISQAFFHVGVIREEVQKGHYDLIGPNGEIILPGAWDSTVQPGWAITMHMWSIPAEEEIRRDDDKKTDRMWPWRMIRHGSAPNASRKLR